MLILAADLHIKPGTQSVEDFRRFLSWVSTTDWDIAFLGDVLDLWIGLPAYEDELCRQFLQWCNAERQRRNIYFLEGNHEYFVLKYHADCFTASGTDALDVGTIRLTHGDTCQNNPSHLRFRWWVKSKLAHFLLRWLPFAAAYVRHLKQKLERKSRNRTKALPLADISAWSTREFQSSPGTSWLVIGHFHHQLLEKRRNNQNMVLMPAWKDQQKIGLLDTAKNSLAIVDWRRIKSTNFSPSQN